MVELERLAGYLLGVAPEREALVAFPGTDGCEVDCLVAPGCALESADAFAERALTAIAREVELREAPAVAILVPVQRWRDGLQICPAPDAEGMAVCAAERFEGGAKSLAVFAGMHELGDAHWREAHDDAWWLVASLRAAVAF